MNQQFINYLTQVVGVLNAHADKNEAMAQMINLTAKFMGKTVTQSILTPVKN